MWSSRSGSEGSPDEAVQIVTFSRERAQSTTAASSFAVRARRYA